MTRNKLLKNISWLFFDKIIRILGGLFVGIWIARYLGPKDFGILNYALAYTAMFSLFVNLGFNQILVREIVKKPKLTPYLMGTSFGLKLIGAFIAIILISISTFIMDTDTFTRWIILIISIGFLFQSIDVIDFFYQSQVLSKYVVIARNLAFIISSLIKVYMILNSFELAYFAVVITLEFLFAACLLLIIYKFSGYHIVQWRYSHKIAISLLRDSWPLALSIFLIAVHTKIDQIMIGNMLDSSQVGIYSVAVKLTEVWLFIPGILISTLIPYFVKLRERDTIAYHNRLLQLYSFTFWIGVCAGVIALIWGKEIIRVLYGDIYLPAYQALVLNMWIGIFISQAVARGVWMINENLQKYRLYNNMLAVVTNITLNTILIPLYGISGAAAASLISIGIGTWGFSFLFKPLRESTLAMIKSINPYYLLYKKA